MRTKEHFPHEEMSVESPMPFGGESCEDKEDITKVSQALAECHQCLSAGSPVRTMTEQVKLLANAKSPMPFGGESCEDQGNNRTHHR